MGFHKSNSRSPGTAPLPLRRIVNVRLVTVRSSSRRNTAIQPLGTSHPRTFLTIPLPRFGSPITATEMT